MLRCYLIGCFDRLANRTYRPAGTGRSAQPLASHNRGHEASRPPKRAFSMFIVVVMIMVDVAIAIMNMIMIMIGMVIIMPLEAKSSSAPNVACQSLHGRVRMS